MLYLFNGLDLYTTILLILALLFVLLYEAINGFHDTANAVATIIYTKALSTQSAVIMAGIFDFLGVLLGGLSVAYAIVHLLPTDLLLDVGSSHNLIMIFAILMSAIIWNWSTWYYGLPASSSHTLIGAIIGVAITNALINKFSILQALNINKVVDIFLSLILSPAIGFIISGILIFILKKINIRNHKKYHFHQTPLEYKKKYNKDYPPLGTRISLIISAIGVSFSHGANDGQKGIGLIMLVLISVAPTNFVININANTQDIQRTHNAIENLKYFYKKYESTENINFNDVFKKNNNSLYCHHVNFNNILQKASYIFNTINTYVILKPTERIEIRKLLICLSDTANNIANANNLDSFDSKSLHKISNDLLNTIEYAPIWIIISVALALSIGTMIGWKRVVITIGEKIGKKNMSYAQGVSAQITAAISIGIASYTGMPVSTTQVLSSAIAGTMIVDGDGVQINTIKNILLAWVLTIPVSISMSGLFYYIMLHCI
uniref:Phosphate transporter n=1 Tax=Candidatus Aschnera chinzeii TaxID=1485666 RepID=A0AAT9G3V4_9ENTR|nr:MAG: inorganic phosphate transporter PitA [Candidatus Aschnera chinzeii]